MSVKILHEVRQRYWTLTYKVKFEKKQIPSMQGLAVYSLLNLNQVIFYVEATKAVSITNQFNSPKLVNIGSVVQILLNEFHLRSFWLFISARRCAGLYRFWTSGLRNWNAYTLVKLGSILLNDFHLCIDSLFGHLDSLGAEILLSGS